MLCRFVAKDEKDKQDKRITEMQAEACNWPQAVQAQLTALGMPPISRIGLAGAFSPVDLPGIVVLKTDQHSSNMAPIEKWIRAV